MRDYIIFYKLTPSGPYPGSGTTTKVFESWVEIYQPSQKDIALGNLEDSSVNVTVLMRNAYPEFVPNVGNSFVIQTGMYKNLKFNIKNVSPKDINTIKVVGVLWE